MMENSKYTTSNIINQIQAVKNGKANKTSVCILIGAGADIASGGKTFARLKYDLLKENGIDVPSNMPKEKVSEKFDKLVDKFNQNGRCIELEKIMREDFSPSEGYKLLVILAECGYIDAVVTTNFDTILEETEKELSMHPFDVYAPGMSIPDNFYLNRSKIHPVYLKMHGDIYGRYISHLTQKEINTKPYGTEFVQLLKNILSNYFIIVIGYGGYDDLITDIFKSISTDDTPIYWCDVKEQEPDSPLAKVLKEQQRLYYVKNSFDGFFKEMGLSFFEKQELSDTNPHFLSTIVQAKANSGKEQYASITDYLPRCEIVEQIDEFIIDTNNNVITLHGKKGMGKSTFVRQLIDHYKDFLVIPIKLKNDASESFLKNIANAIGYQTDVPFSLMYNFVKWCNKEQKNIIFILDEICITNNFESNIKYLKELSDFFSVAAQYCEVKFVLFTDEGTYEYMENALAKTSYSQLLSNTISISGFSDKEIKSLLKKYNITDSIKENIYELLANPYIWNLISRKKYIINAESDNFIGESIEELVCSSTNINKASLQLYLEKCANAIIEQKNIQRNQDMDKCLLNNHIINSDGCFVYDIYTEYYYYRHLKRIASSQDLFTASVSMPALDLKKSILRNAYARMFSDIDSAEELKKNIEKLEFVRQISNKPYDEILIYDIFKHIHRHKYLHLKNYILNTKPNAQELQPLLKVICYTSAFASEDPYEVLNYISKLRSDMQYDNFIIKNTYAYRILFLPVCPNKITTYLQLYLERFQNQSTESNFLDFLYSLTGWGPDSLNNTNYQEMINAWEKFVCEQKEQLFSESAFLHATNQIKYYSYNVLFNSGTDVDEKFLNAVNNERLRNIISIVLSGKSISLKEYMEMITLTTDINNMWIFLICNFVTVLSMENDAVQTKEIFKLALHQLEQEDLVKRLDFYLSSIFMSLNISLQEDDEFNSYFENVIDLFERVLFETPSVRYATSQRFSDEFEQMFEDGFNPLAFYFYTAPGACNKANQAWNNGKEHLSHYWNLVHNLEQIGNFSAVLRIVHALGQMISIYPKEGFAALENLADCPHEIVRRGILRILKENYLRYPEETMEFIKNKKLKINEEELIQLKTNNQSKWQNRALEQLHWYRLFVNLSHILHKDIVLIFLEKINKSPSYASCMNAFFEDVFS